MALRSRIRPFLGLVHRWFGLFTAGFLFVAGLTGAIISWDHELDAWLNPELYHSEGGASSMSPLVLADRLEATDPRLRVTYLPLAVTEGHTLQLFVQPRIDPATGEPFVLGFDQIALDPGTGEVQGRRTWGEAGLRRENLLPFLYKLHYSLHLPEAFGFETGVLFMGLVAMVWTVDAFVALWLAFPSVGAWRKSFLFRWRDGGWKLVFDVHRSGGVWLWALLLALAVTAVSMNLGDSVMRPLVSVFSTLTPSPFDLREPAPAPIDPSLDRAAAITLARTEADRRGWTEPTGALFYAETHGLYGVGFFAPGNDHGDGGLGNAWLYFDGVTGTPAGADVPGEGTLGDIFLQAQFPVHSGRILGLWGRIGITALGIAVAALSATGVVWWARRQRWARAASSAVAFPVRPIRIPT